MDVSIINTNKYDTNLELNNSFIIYAFKYYWVIKHTEKKEKILYIFNPL
jgi:hypothetical protein